MQPPSQRNTAATQRGADHERTRALHREPGRSNGPRHDIERALDLLQPTIEATIADREVSHDQALVIVVVDPDAPAGSAVEDSILVQREFGRAGRVDVDYARHAIDKARASLREHCDTSILRERGSALLSADLPIVGGLHRRGWTLGVSGAQPMFDEAIGAMLVELVVAIQSHRAAHEAALPSKE